MMYRLQNKRVVSKTPLPPRRIIRLRSLFLLFARMKRNKKIIILLRSQEDVIINVVKIMIVIVIIETNAAIIELIQVSPRPQLCFNNLSKSNVPKKANLTRKLKKLRKNITNS